MAMTPDDTPLADIEASIKQEVDGINARRRPYMQPLPRTEDAVTPAPQPPRDPVSLPDMIGAAFAELDHHIAALSDRLDERLTRIERALGITS